MNRWIRGLVPAVALTAALAAPVLVPAATGAAAACAAVASDSPHAGLVVDTGGRTTTYCVGLDASSVSGIHLIQLAAAQFGLQYSLGFGGLAVCQLEGVGPAGDDCFGEYPDFWGYWHGDGASGWSWAGSGAGSAVVNDGDVDGWSWGTGATGTTHASPPSLGIGQVCVASTPPPTTTPPTTPAGGGSGSGSGGGSGGSESSSGHGSGGSTTGDGGAATGSAGTGSGGAGGTSTGASASTTDPGSTTSMDGSTTGTAPATIAQALGAPGSGSSGGPPLGAFVAIVVIVGLAVAGAFRLRLSRGGARTPRSS